MFCLSPVGKIDRFKGRKSGKIRTTVERAGYIWYIQLPLRDGSGKDSPWDGID